MIIIGFLVFVVIIAILAYLDELDIIWSSCYSIGEFLFTVIATIFSFIIQRTVDVLHFFIKALLSLIR